MYLRWSEFAMKNTGSYVLGLDLGVASVGWAAVRYDKKKQSGKILATGARIFEPGMDNNIGEGRGVSRNVKRREARQARRQGDRRKRRMRKLLHRLQAHDLLPEGDPTIIIPALDKNLLKKFRPDGEDAARFAHILPYFLRTRALDEKLEPYELGRALYHLGQRRGFKSNKLIDAAEDKKELGKVSEGITELTKKIHQAGARTLGEYFAGLAPEEDRIRSRWTSRDMFEHEFNAIMDAQSAHNPDLLTGDVRKTLQKCIFDQRPLKSVAHLVGFCELEPGQRRAPWLRLEAQRFRMLQRLLDTRVMYPDGSEQPFSHEQIQTLKDTLGRQASLTFGRARRLLGIKGGAKFNWEEGGEKGFKGNTTSAKLFQIFGERWFELSEEDRRQVVEDIYSFEKEEALEKRGRKRWGLSAEGAAIFSKVVLEPDYCRLSLKAIRKLLPLMESGIPYATAVKEEYGGFHRREEVHDLLPLAGDVFPYLLNPVVNRVLTELRKVVNSVVREFGRPAAINVELARDMRKTKKQRQEITKRNRKNETRRQSARKAVIAETKISDPRRDDVVKYLLAEECEWECPYTGKKITPRLLFGKSPQFDVEHIIPFSRSLDNSYLNKTLCCLEENRKRKRNNTPWEAYGTSDPERYGVILQRVKNFTGDAGKEKLRRFMIEEIGDIEEWATNQLNDTRYASRLAVRYLGMLYGGREDETGKQRIFATRGGATGFVRSVWQLNSILNDGPRKTRDDHRHHAVDAVAIALTTPGTIKMLSDAAKNARLDRRHLFARVAEPWGGFLQDVKKAVNAIDVSHKPERKLSGALHKDTLYSSTRNDENGKECVHQRVPLAKLKPKDIADIVDPVVRETVRRKLDQLGGDTKKFEDEKNHPVLVSKDGARSRPIHKVRVRRVISTIPVAKGERRRYVAPGYNHHMEIVECKDAKGKMKWEGSVVTTFEATRRLKEGEPVVREYDGPGKRFICSITSGDMATIEEDGQRKLIVVRVISHNRVEFVSQTDARLKKDIKAAKEWFIKTPNGLRSMKFQKVTVTPLGEVRRAND